MKTCLQHLEGRVQGWIYRVRRPGIAEEKPRGWASPGGHEGPSLSVVRPRPQAHGEGGGAAGSALFDLGPWHQAEVRRPLQCLAGSLLGKPRGVLGARVSGVRCWWTLEGPSPMDRAGARIFPGGVPVCLTLTFASLSAITCVTLFP